MHVVQFIKDNAILVTTLSVLVSFGIVIALNPIVIPVLRRLKFGQSIREEGPKSHQKKFPLHYQHNYEYSQVFSYKYLFLITLSLATTV